MNGTAEKCGAFLMRQRGTITMQGQDGFRRLTEEEKKQWKKEYLDKLIEELKRIRKELEDGPKYTE